MVEEWKNNKRKAGAKHAFVDTKKSLRDINPGRVDYLLGNILVALIIRTTSYILKGIQFVSMDNRMDNLYLRYFLQLPP